MTTITQTPTPAEIPHQFLDKHAINQTDPTATQDQLGAEGTFTDDDETQFLYEGLLSEAGKFNAKYPEDKDSMRRQSKDGTEDTNWSVVNYIGEGARTLSRLPDDQLQKLGKVATERIMTKVTAAGGKHNVIPNDSPELLVRRMVVAAEVERADKQKDHSRDTWVDKSGNL